MLHPSSSAAPFLQPLQDSPEKCCDACRSTAGCNVWVFCGGESGCPQDRARGECWLKKKAELNAVHPQGRRVPGAGPGHGWEGGGKEGREGGRPACGSISNLMAHAAAQRFAAVGGLSNGGCASSAARHSPAAHAGCGWVSGALFTEHDLLESAHKKKQQEEAFEVSVRRAVCIIYMLGMWVGEEMHLEAAGENVVMMPGRSGNWGCRQGAKHASQHSGSLRR